jgi:hypothetical protein
VLAGAAIALWCALASRPLLVRARAELRAPAAGPLDARSG